MEERSSPTVWRYLRIGKLYQSVEGTDDRAHRSGGDGVVKRGSLKAHMPEQRLDDANMNAVLQLIRGDAVTQGVRADPLVDARASAGSTTMQWSYRVLSGLR